MDKAAHATSVQMDKVAHVTSVSGISVIGKPPDLATATTSTIRLHCLCKWVLLVCHEKLLDCSIPNCLAMMWKAATLIGPQEAALAHRAQN